MARSAPASAGTAAQLPVAPPVRSSFDLATFLGLLGGLTLISAAIILGGRPAAFIDLPAILIVVGGSFAVTSISFTLREVMRAQRVLFKTFIQTSAEPGDVAEQMLQLADVARRNGVLALQSYLPDLEREQFIYNGLGMVVDGTPAEDVERVMRQDVEALIQRHTRSAGVLRRAAEVSPAMGLIGTLIGLVQMLGSLDTPSEIGPAMAVALLTTFYGACLANMVFAPMAAKLERNTQDEVLIRNIYLVSVASIARQENPRRLEMLLNTILPPDQRLSVYD